MDEYMSRQYDTEEVNRIIRQALEFEKRDTIGHKELMETARELGIDQQKMEAAIRREMDGNSREAAKQAWMRRKHSKFHAHLWSYTIVNGGLFLINVMTPGAWWFQWPLLGWGIGLAFDFRQAYFPTEEQVEKGIRWALRRRKKMGLF
jgi:hypothetical protein